jgi:hypothetical protein
MPSPFYDENSWKEIIDPAFDKTVKTYIKYLCKIEQELPNKGQVKFKDESIELIRKNNNLSPDYGNESGAEMLQFTENIGLITEQEYKVFSNASCAIDEYSTFSDGIKKAGFVTRFLNKLSFRFGMRDKITSQIHSLIELSETLPEEESRQYYANKINVFINGICTKHSCQPQEEIEFLPLSILIRIALNRMDEISEESATKEEIEHLKESFIVISKMMGSIYSTMSQLSHQKSMPELLKNIKKGDDKSLFNAVTIDKTLVSSELAGKRLGQAQAAGDNKFLNKMGKKIAKRPLESVAKYGRTYAVLEFFWYMELYKLNNQELYYFLKSCDLKLPEFQDAFDRFLLRHIKKIK